MASTPLDVAGSESQGTCRPLINQPLPLIGILIGILTIRPCDKREGLLIRGPLEETIGKAIGAGQVLVSTRVTELIPL